ncbi:MAG: hypothetical protein JW715_04940 [Sedimentisphaerales bacterium]|nr:hypothetical protein [Sedimentisphaerales bacterium]
MKKARYFTACVTVLLVLAGCGPGIRKPLKICPGKNSVAEALMALQSQSQNMVPLYARGKSRLQYYDEKGKKRKENLDVVKILVKSPEEIYLQGDKSVIPKAVILGANEREFWLAIKPEISSYWWGRWSDLDSSQNLLMNPKTLIEALGIAAIDMNAEWSLSNDGPFDILTKRIDGMITKKIYIYCFDYTIRKIEYFDLNGQMLACAELDSYKDVTDNFSVPGYIKVTTFGEQKEDSIIITFNLGSIKQKQFSEKQNEFFERYPSRSYKNLYRLENGNWIELKQ